MRSAPYDRRWAHGQLRVISTTRSGIVRAHDATRGSARLGAVLRAVVYGSSGAGKSTFSSVLALQLEIAHVEIDVLAYDSNGVHVEQDHLRRRFELAIAGDGWVVEGVHRDQLYRALAVADTFIWLDYSKAAVARRLGERLLSQLFLRQKRHGRRTTPRSAFRRELPFIRKTLRSYERRREHGEALAAKAAELGLQVHRIPSPAAAVRLLQSLRIERPSVADENP